MSMFKVHRKEIEWGGRKLILETGKIARQADGAVMATYGETTVLCTAVGAKAPKPVATPFKRSRRWNSIYASLDPALFRRCS